MPTPLSVSVFFDFTIILISHMPLGTRMPITLGTDRRLVKLVEWY